MQDLIPIQTLVESELRTMLRDAAVADDPVRAVSRLVASVDWTGTDPDGEANEVARMLGEAAGLAEEASEGDIRLEEFLGQMRLLTENITVAHAAEEPMNTSTFRTILSGRVSLGAPRTETVLIFA